ncbi:MAG: type IV secretory system conjugative DNA transfer family protein [Solirubrobacterales bacterium]
MRRTELIWYRLRFPRDLEGPAVLAALSAFSGVESGTRLAFDLAASRDGISHHLAVSPKAAEAVLGSLRAAIPSLRLDQTEPPRRQPTRRALWQVSPPTAVIRTDAPAAIAAGLLASLFPLREHEAVALTWTMRPHLRPPLPLTPEIQRDGRQRVLMTKLTLPGLNGYGVLSVQAKTSARNTQLMRRTAASLWSLSTPFGRLVADPYWYGQLLRVLAQRGRYLSVAELMSVIGWPIDGPDLPGLELGAAKRLVPSLALPDKGRVLGLSDAAGVTRPVAITASAGTRGLYILGPTGTGKTSLIKNLVRDDLVAGRGLAVVETNGDLVRDLLDLIPPERIKDVVLIDLTDRSHAVGFNPFASAADPSLIADQLGELFQRLWSAYWGPRTGQLAHMGLLTLARRDGSTLLDLPRLFLDQAFRGRVLSGVDDPVGLEPDWRWYESLPVREQATVIAPLLNKVRQFTARSSIRAIMGQARPALSMQRLMAEHQVLLVYVPKGLIGSETAQLMGCLILTSLWQAATERARLPLSQRTPFGLYVDEVQDFADAPIPWDEMFAQGRKYGLALTVAHQNLDQLPKDLREVVLANARSKAVFALSASDAKVMERLFAPALTAADLQALDAHGVAAIVALDDGGTARPVTLTTPPPPSPQGSAELVHAASRQRYARPISEVEAELRRQVAGPRPPAAPIGRKPRVAK